MRIKSSERGCEVWTWLYDTMGLLDLGLLDLRLMIDEI
jgi:hypothetical protein